MWYFLIARDTVIRQSLSLQVVLFDSETGKNFLSLYLKRQGTCSDEVYKYHCEWSEKAKMHWQGLEGVAVSFGDDVCFALVLFIKERMHFIQQADSGCLGDSENPSSRQVWIISVREKNQINKKEGDSSASERWFSERQSHIQHCPPCDLEQKLKHRSHPAF